MKLYSNKKIKKGRLQVGFTLVEMLVAIAVFMSVMVVAMGSLISIINANKKSQAIKSAVDNITFVLDSLSRKVELGDDYRCTTSANITNGVPNPSFSCSGTDCNCAENGVAIQYHDKNKDKYIQYVFINVPNGDDGNVQQRICSPEDGSCGSWQSLTGPVSNVNIKNMTFYVLGVGASENTTLKGSRRQPKIIITAEGSAGSGDTGSDFILQTSVSETGRQYYSD